MQRSARHRPDQKLAFGAICVAALIVYGSLYPFQFHAGLSGPEALQALLGTWKLATGRGDAAANMLLYIPLGLCLAGALRCLPRYVANLISVLVGATLSFSLELTQSFTVDRNPALADVYFDSLGTFFGAAAGTLLLRDASWPWRLPLARRPFVILVVGCWAGYRLFPGVPVIDLHKYWTAVKPLADWYALSPLDVYRHIVVVLTLGMLCEALVGTARSRSTTSYLIFGVLCARILIIGAALSPAEVLGSGIGLTIWWMGLAQWARRAPVTTGLLAGLVVLQGLDPFQFSSSPHKLELIPFSGFLNGSLEVNIRSFLEKAFLYGSLVWLFVRSGIRFSLSTAISASLVLSVRLFQTYLPSRSAELSDALMILLLSGGMKWMGEDPAEEFIPDESIHGKNLWHGFLIGFYDTLMRNDTVEPADLIVVIAGRMDRKHYGLELYSRKLAPRLVLSVGRFEVSKLHHLKLEGLETLIALRDRTPPHDRNFFVQIDQHGTKFDLAGFTSSTTYGEIAGLCKYLAQHPVRRVMIVSTGVHLSRVAMTINKVFREVPIAFHYCAVPPEFDHLEREYWWKTAENRDFVLKEMAKLVGYKMLLLLPQDLCGRLMELRR